jgi:hypothetical protein
MMDIKQIRQRIMCEAYDLADRGDHEGYNAVKVMCSDVLKSIAAVVAAEREACAKVCDDIRRMGGYSAETPDWERGTGHCADAIRARGNT